MASLASLQIEKHRLRSSGSTQSSSITGLAAASEAITFVRTSSQVAFRSHYSGGLDHPPY